MANALKWIINEAKKLRREYPHRFDNLKNPWAKGYMAEASAIYAKKHKGKSPVGKKKKARRRIGVAEGHKKGKPVPGITIFHPMHSVGRAKKRRRKVGARGPITYRFIRKPGQRLKPVGSVGSRRKSSRRPSLKTPPRLVYGPNDPAFLTFPKIPWYHVKDHNIGFVKIKGQYYTTKGRLIVWDFGSTREAQAWLKKHCLKSK